LYLFRKLQIGFHLIANTPHRIFSLYTQNSFKREWCYPKKESLSPFHQKLHFRLYLCGYRDLKLYFCLQLRSAL